MRWTISTILQVDTFFHSVLKPKNMKCHGKLSKEANGGDRSTMLVGKVIPSTSYRNGS